MPQTPQYHGPEWSSRSRRAEKNHTSRTATILIIGIPAVNSISQDVVSPGLKGISWGLAGVITMICGAAWSPSAVGIISDALGGGASGLKAALMMMSLLGVIACFCFWRGSKHYTKDMEKVQGFTLEAER